uniref:AAA+ ATPase domain-containing protein n=1 Tax=viral metagenome TaxID=1070528 RepID=A0A6C0EQ16_9ZZZZ
MLKRKRTAHSDMEQIHRKRRIKPRVKLQDAPPVNSINDLIELGRSIKFYRNLDTIMLWRITPYLEELNKMVGMDSLKETVFYQVIYYLQGMHTRNRNEEYLHTAIYGPPGTGKTSVSKIIGKIYQATGILSADSPFKIAYRDDFVAGYLGQTANKTKKLLKSCIGGVLFIDEVYSLAPRNSDRDSFAKEAIDTLNGFLSEHKNDFCCIIAGYEDEIRNCFFAMNKGLERRFPWVHRIPEYTSGELYQIFMKMIKEMEWDTAFEEKDLVPIFEQNKDFFKNAGGDIETFLSKCKMVHSRRVFSMSKEHKFVLTKEDIHTAIEFLKKNNEKRETDKPPDGMYT